MQKEKPQKIVSFMELTSLRNEVNEKEKEEAKRREQAWLKKRTQKNKRIEINEKTKLSKKQTEEKEGMEGVTKIIETRKKRIQKDNQKAVDKLIQGIQNHFLEKEKDNPNNMEQQKPINQENTEKEKNIENIAKVLGIEKSELIKEPWLEAFLEFKDKLDSKSYIDEINKKEQKSGGFDRKYFTEKWPYSLYSIAGAITYKELLNLFQSGKIKGPSHVFTEEEIKTIFNGIKISKKEKVKGKETITEKTIEEICKEQKERVEKTIIGIENAIKNTTKRNLKLLDTPLGNIIFHDYISLGKYPNGTDRTNVIYSDLGFLTTRAFGFDTFIEYNEKNKYFSITSKDKSKLKELGEKLGMKNLEGVTVLTRGLNGMTEKELLDAISLDISKNEKSNLPKKEKLQEKDFFSLIEDKDPNEIEMTPELEETLLKKIEELEKRKEERGEKIKKLEMELEKIKMQQ